MVSTSVYSGLSTLLIASVVNAVKIPLDARPLSRFDKLWGAEVMMPSDGSVNCVIDGVDVGFHCIMRKRGFTNNHPALTGDVNPLIANRNADMCYNKRDQDVVHCHGSDNSAFYRHVITDHLNRGYVGALDCRCGYDPNVNAEYSAEGFVSDCDITTTKNPVDGTATARYDNGQGGVCNADTVPAGQERTNADRKDQYSWKVARWGLPFLSGEDLMKFNYNVQYIEALNSNIVGEPITQPLPGNSCKEETITVYKFGEYLIETRMTRPIEGAC